MTTNRKKYLILFSIVLIGMVVVSSDFFHNHSIDLIDHTDCPVFHLQLTLMSVAFCFVIQLLSLTGKQRPFVLLSQAQPLKDVYKFLFGNKAPPAR